MVNKGLPYGPDGARRGETGREGRLVYSPLYCPDDSLRVTFVSLCLASLHGAMSDLMCQMLVYCGYMVGRLPL